MGGSLENKARFALEIYRNMRKKVGAEYPIGIKINSADFQRSAFTEEESLEVIDILSAEGMDMIEVSGGTYEKAAMIGAGKKVKESTKKREAYFADFIVKARTKAPLPSAFNLKLLVDFPPITTSFTTIQFWIFAFLLKSNIVFESIIENKIMDIDKYFILFFFKLFII